MAYLNYTFNFILRLIIVASFFISQAHGRIGCASFGHSCYGGQGKRASLENSEPSLVQNVPVLEESDPRILRLRELKEQSEFDPEPGSLGFRRFSPGQYVEINKFVKDWKYQFLHFTHVLTHLLQRNYWEFADYQLLKGRQGFDVTVKDLFDSQRYAAQLND